MVEHWGCYLVGKLVVMMVEAMVELKAALMVVKRVGLSAGLKAQH